jgi:hypothetical protein
LPDEIDIAVKRGFKVIQAMFSSEEPQVKGSRSGPQVKGVNNIVVTALGSDDVASSVPQLLGGAIISSVEHFLMLCLYNETRKCGRLVLLEAPVARLSGSGQS